MKTNHCIAIGLLIAAPAAAGCKAHSAEKPPIPVKVKAVEAAPSSGEVRYSASITARTQVDLAFKVGGYVEAICQVRGFDGRMRSVQEGDVISKGTVLARVRQSDYAVKVGQAESQASQARSGIDSSRAQVLQALSNVDASKASLAEAEASFARARLDYDRAESLFSSQSMTRADYDAAKAQHDVTQAQWEAAKSQVAVAEAKADMAKAQVDASEAQAKGAQAALDEARIPLGDTSLRAPMNSVILQRKVEVGSLVSPGSPGFVLADTSSVKAVFGVPDTMVDNLKLGSRIVIRSEAELGADFSGQITSISPSADSKSRVFEVEVTIPNRENRLKVGMVVALALEEANAPDISAVVPLSAVVRSRDNPNGYAVFVVEEREGKQIARIRNVDLGEAFGNTVAVVSGLKTGERVVTTGETLIVDGEHVNVIP